VGEIDVTNQSITDGSDGLQDVRLGSLADIAAALSNVRFTPESGHRRKQSSCPLCARNGLMRYSKKRPMQSPHQLGRAAGLEARTTSLEVDDKLDLAEPRQVSTDYPIEIPFSLALAATRSAVSKPSLKDP
jgi:hypothetical protein